MNRPTLFWLRFTVLALVASTLLQAASRPEHLQALKQCRTHQLESLKQQRNTRIKGGTGCFTDQTRHRVWFIHQNQKQTHWDYQPGTYQPETWRQRPSTPVPGDMI